VDLRIVLGCVLLGALAAGVAAAAGDRDYRARSYVIRVPPEFSGERGLRLARSERVLRRALLLAGEDAGGVEGLRRSSTAELTSRLDLSFTVRTGDRRRSAALATAYAKAYRSEIPRRAGLTTHGRGARDSQRTLGPLGWTLLGGAAGLWLGMALAIVRDGLSRGSARAARPASPPCAPGRRATRG
jgi:hypothetical protein